MCHATTFHARRLHCAPGWGMQNQKAPMFYFPAHPQMSALLSLLVGHCLLRGWAACMAMNEGGKEHKEEMDSFCSMDMARRLPESRRAGRAATACSLHGAFCTLLVHGGADAAFVVRAGRGVLPPVLEDPRAQLPAFPWGNTSTLTTAGERSACNSCLNKGCLEQQCPNPTSAQHLMLPSQSLHTPYKAFDDH